MAAEKPLARKLRTALRMRGGDRALAAEAAVALLDARLRSRLLPFRTLARQLGGLTSPPATREPATVALDPDQAETVRKVRWAITATAPWMPFRAVCLQQAIAARRMLARRGIGSVLHLGVDRRRPGRLDAHAWLDAGDIKVTGYPLDPAFDEVGRFV